MNTNRHKIIVPVGARPNFMKAAPLVSQIRQLPDMEVILVHSGQHYDNAMSDVFFRDLNLVTPDIFLNVGRTSQSKQTSTIIDKFDEILNHHNPDAVIVVGDVNTTLACALSTIQFKPSGNRRSPLLMHVEAGLRSFDRSIPEEINRVVTDAISDILFTTETDANRNLRNEGIPREKIHFVGNLMIDTLLRTLPISVTSEIRKELGLLGSDYVLLTLHRPSNVDNPEVLGGIMKAAVKLSERIPVLFPIHPRTSKMLGHIGPENTSHEVSRYHSYKNSNVWLLPPLGYLDFLQLMQHTNLVLTDSGGIQEETTILNVPCLTLRRNTERPVTVKLGTNKVIGTSPTKVLEEAYKALDTPIVRSRRPPLWDGKAGQRIAVVISKILGDS